MERMIEVEIDIFDSQEYDRWLKSKEEFEDETLSEVDRLVKETNLGASSHERPKPTVAKFRFTPSSLMGVFETFSMEQAEKKDKRLDNIMLVFNTGMEQRANLSLKQWDRLIKKWMEQDNDTEDI
jgi:hypothetical protein